MANTFQGEEKEIFVCFGSTENLSQYIYIILTGVYNMQNTMAVGGGMAAGEKRKKKKKRKKNLNSMIRRKTFDFGVFEKTVVHLW